MNTSSTFQINYLVFALLFSCNLLSAQISQGTSEAPGPQSIASGTNSMASGAASLALGSGAIASGDHSASIGLNTNVSGDNATALGHTNLAIGDASFVIGQQNAARSLGETVLGTFAKDYSPANSNSNETWYGTDRLLTLANGTSEINRSNALVVYKDGYTELDGKLEVSKSINVGQDDSGIEVQGDIRYNTSNADFEGFTGSEWKSFTKSSQTSTPTSPGLVYLHIPGIPGSLNVYGGGMIEVLNWSWGITQSATTHDGGGGGAGGATHYDISITKYAEKSSVPLHRAAVLGDHITEATLVMEYADGTPYMMIELVDIIVKSQTITGYPESIPHIEDITLNFAEYTITYFEADEQGNQIGLEFGWDIPGNTPN